jgi:hypothetical protein
MVEAPRHLIRAGAGRVRVLRLVCADGHCYPLVYTARPGAGMCKLCGCTRQYACPGGCSWADSSKTVCSACEARICR